MKGTRRIHLFGLSFFARVLRGFGGFLSFSFRALARNNANGATRGIRSFNWLDTFLWHWGCNLAFGMVTCFGAGILEVRQSLAHLGRAQLSVASRARGGVQPMMCTDITCIKAHLRIKTFAFTYIEDAFCRRPSHLA